jgi:hypothetical protein
MAEPVSDAEQKRRDREYAAYLKRAHRRVSRPLVAEPDPWKQIILKPSDIFNYLIPDPQPIRRKRTSK